ncbi:MAG: hypothetical protein U1D30_25615 [Planctomycetota bacterium]
MRSRKQSLPKWFPLLGMMAFVLGEWAASTCLPGIGVGAGRSR